MKITPSQNTKTPFTQKQPSKNRNTPTNIYTKNNFHNSAMFKQPLASPVNDTSKALRIVEMQRRAHYKKSSFANEAKGRDGAYFSTNYLKSDSVSSEKLHKKQIVYNSVTSDNHNFFANGVSNKVSLRGFARKNEFFREEERSHRARVSKARRQECFISA